MFAAMSGHGPIVSELMKVGFRDMVDVVVDVVVAAKSFEMLPGVVFFLKGVLL